MTSYLLSTISRNRVTRWWRWVSDRVADTRLRKWRPLIRESSLPARLESHAASGLLPRRVVLALSMLSSKLIRETFRAFFCRIRGEVAGLLVRVLIQVVRHFFASDRRERGALITFVIS